jgi:hypothetical protein
MKKIGLLTVLIMATLLFALAFTAAAAGPKAAATPAVTAPVTAPAVAAPAPPHPRVEHALEALRGARDHMAHAEGEFHGHRDKAIEHIDQAIHEAEICMQEP